MDLAHHVHAHEPVDAEQADHDARELQRAVAVVARAQLVAQHHVFTTPEVDDLRLDEREEAARVRDLALMRDEAGPECSASVLLEDGARVHAAVGRGQDPLGRVSDGAEEHAILADLREKPAHVLPEKIAVHAHELVGERLRDAGPIVKLPAREGREPHGLPLDHGADLDASLVRMDHVGRVPVGDRVFDKLHVDHVGAHDQILAQVVLALHLREPAHHLRLPRLHDRFHLGERDVAIAFTAVRCSVNRLHVLLLLRSAVNRAVTPGVDGGTGQITQPRQCAP